MPTETESKHSAIRYFGHTGVLPDNTLSGYISVANVGYEKTVFMRATKDTWETYEDFEAEWLCSADGGQRDRVAFTLPLEEDISTVEFAIGFLVHGQKYWDNNDVLHTYHMHCNAHTPQS